MENKVKIELDELEAKEFELFQLCKLLANNKKFEYIKHESIRDGRLIIHLKLVN